MEQKKLYVILKSNNLADLEDKVNKYISLGYKPYWNLYIATDDTLLSEAHFAQCMVENSLTNMTIDEIGNIKKGSIVSTNAGNVQVSGTITVNE